MSGIPLNDPLFDKKLAQLEEARGWGSRVISQTMIRLNLAIPGERLDA